MKKILFLSLLALVAFAACKPDAPKYQINGKVTGDMKGKTVYLKQLDKMRPGTAIDSVVIVDSTFILKGGSVSSPDLYNLSIGGEKTGMNLFVENLPIEVTLDAVDPTNNKAVGSPLNDSYSSYLKWIKENVQTKLIDLDKRWNEAAAAQPNKKLTPELEKQFNGEYDQIMADYKAYQIKFINDNPNSIVSAYVLRTIASRLTPEEIEKSLVTFDTIIGKSYFIVSTKEDLEKMKKVAIGQPFTDIKLPNPEGKEIALSDYAGKGKYVLIDFWASWCGPCRAENPNVVALYNKYKNKGFEIVGVSLDRNKEDWVKGIADDKITWPQMSDLAYWNNVGARAYNIGSIPSTVLLDKDGVIIAKDLRGEQLAAKLAELLDKK